MTQCQLSPSRPHTQPSVHRSPLCRTPAQAACPPPIYLPPHPLDRQPWHSSRPLTYCGLSRPPALTGTRETRLPSHGHTPPWHTDHPPQHTCLQTDTQTLRKDIHTVTYLQRLFPSCGNKTSDLEASEIRLYCCLLRNPQAGRTERSITDQKLKDHFILILKINSFFQSLLYIHKYNARVLPTLHSSRKCTWEPTERGPYTQK